MSTSSTALSRGLGLASLALGVPQVAAPDRFAQAIGASGRGDARDATVAVGLRELTVGLGLLGRRRSTPVYLWARVAGDVMDLVLLGRTLRSSGRGNPRTAAATAATLGLTAVDLHAARRAGRAQTAQGAPTAEGAPTAQDAQTGKDARAGKGRGASSSALELTAAITVGKPPQEVYDFWRGLERLPTFMHHLQSVEWTGEGRTRWTANAPVKKQVTWDAELVDDVPGEVIAWRSLPGADIANEGSVRFTPAPGDRGTEVRVRLRYDLPGGRAGALVARVLGEEPHQQVEDDLRRFKQVLETGEVVRSEGTPEGSSARRHLFQHPAQPLASS